MIAVAGASNYFSILYWCASLWKKPISIRWLENVTSYLPESKWLFNEFRVILERAIGIFAANGLSCENNSSVRLLCRNNCASIMIIKKIAYNVLLRRKKKPTDFLWFSLIKRNHHQSAWKPTLTCDILRRITGSLSNKRQPALIDVTLIIQLERHLITPSRSNDQASAKMQNTSTIIASKSTISPADGASMLIRQRFIYIATIQGRAYAPRYILYTFIVRIGVTGLSRAWRNDTTRKKAESLDKGQRHEAAVAELCWSLSEDWIVIVVQGDHVCMCVCVWFRKDYVFLRNQQGSSRWWPVTTHFGNAAYDAVLLLLKYKSERERDYLLWPLYLVRKWYMGGWKHILFFCST